MKRQRNPTDRTGADLHALCRRGLCDLSLFLLVSTIFFFSRGADLLAPLGESARMILGAAPPVAMTSVAVGAYTFSAAVLILGRIAGAQKPSSNWLHLFFRTVFYPFYLFAGALEGHFMGVFFAGLALYALEQLNIWSYAQKTLPRKEALERT